MPALGVVAARSHHYDRAVERRSSHRGQPIDRLYDEILKRLPLARARSEFAVKWRRLPGNVRGSLWVLLGSLFFSIMVVLIKIAGQTLHVTEILFFRQLTMLLLAAPVILRNYPSSLITALPGLQALRVSVAFVAMLRGRVVEGAEPLDPKRLKSLGFVIADKQAGTFRIELGSLSVR